MSFQIQNINDSEQTLFIESVLLKDFATNKKVCIMYLANGYAAERSYRIQDIINIYTKETTSSLEYIYLKITKNSEQDYINLMKIYNNTNIFISAVGSGDCKYLDDLFFKFNNAIHLNSYSTASYLKTAQKLLRIQIPDEKIHVVYSDLIKREKSKSVCIISKNGTYYQGLKNDLINNFEEFNIIKTINIDQEEYKADEILQIAKNINSSGLDKLTVIFIVDFPMNLIIPMMENDKENINFDILISDSGSQQMPNSQELLKYVKEKNSSLITKFISDNQIQTALKYNDIINDKEHPVSSILSLTLSIIDLSENMILTDNKYIRKNYIDINLDENLDNTEAIWGIYSYKYNENKSEYSLDLFGLTFYYGDTAFTSYKNL
jgi:hypothetical protein